MMSICLPNVTFKQWILNLNEERIIIFKQTYLPLKLLHISPAQYLGTYLSFQITELCCNTYLSG